MSKCLMCSSSEKMSEQFFCTSCGSHFHSWCLKPPLEMNALNRIEWLCGECKCCQICKQSRDADNILICETCDKCYHRYCAKNDSSQSECGGGGWKCEICAKVCLSCNTVLSKENESFCLECIESKRNMPPEKVSSTLRKRTSLFGRYK